MAERAQEMKKRLQDYLESNPSLSKYRIDMLSRVNYVICSLGYDWDSVPQNEWKTIYQGIAELNPHRLYVLGGVIRDYFQWLIDQNFLTLRQVTYSPPKGKEIFEGELQYSFLESLDSLYEMCDLSSFNFGRPPAAENLQAIKIFLGFAWMGLNFSQALQLKVSNISFYGVEGLVLSSHCNLDEVLYGVIRIQGENARQEKIIRFTNSTFIAAFFDVWKKNCELFASTGEHAPFFRTSAGTPLTQANLNMRINRTLKRVNDFYYLDLDVYSIRMSGMYDRAYRYWLANNLTWHETPQNYKKFYEVSELRPPVAQSVMLIAFQKFKEYVRYFHPETVL